jgi:hypothetical protein
MSESKDDSSLISIPYICLDEKTITDKILKRLFCEAKRAIIYLEINELLSDLCNQNIQRNQEKSGLIISDSIQKQYRHLYKVSVAIANKIGGRITITLPDGHVVIDTCKGDGNTYNNYIDDVISENHNTRVCILQSQYDPNGVSYERKYSGTTHQREIYVAVRLGQFRNSNGTLRLSIPDNSKTYNLK